MSKRMMNGGTVPGGMNARERLTYPTVSAMAWAMSVPGWKIQLHQRHALDVLRLDVVDAADVEEVVLVVVGDQPFHLLRVHAAVGLADVDDRQIERGEDVDLHSVVRRMPPAMVIPAMATMTVMGRRSAMEMGFMAEMPVYDEDQFPNRTRFTLFGETCAASFLASGTLAMALLTRSLFVRGRQLSIEITGWSPLRFR